MPRDEVRQQNECREVRNPEDVQPKRFGLKYDPPQVVLEYLERSTGKLYHRVITLHKLRPGGDAGDVLSVSFFWRLLVLVSCMLLFRLKNCSCSRRNSRK